MKNHEERFPIPSFLKKFVNIDTRTTKDIISDMISGKSKGYKTQFSALNATDISREEKTF